MCLQPLYFNDVSYRKSAASGFKSELSCDIVGSAVRQRDFITNVFNRHILGNLKLVRGGRQRGFVTNVHKRHTLGNLQMVREVEGCRRSWKGTQ